MYKKIFNPCDECNYHYTRKNQESGMCKICEFKKMQAENASLRARLEKVELPCEVRDKAWLLDLNVSLGHEARIIPCIIDEFTTVRNGTYAVLNGRCAYITWRRFRAVHINDFGKTVFLTEAEALAKLDEMKGGAL